MRSFRAVALLSLVATFSTGCLLTKTVQYEHAVTEQLVSGGSAGEVPSDLQFGGGTVGVFLNPYRDGFAITLLVLGEDIHERLEVEHISVAESFNGEAVLWERPAWDPVSESTTAVVGGLRVGAIVGPVGSGLDSFKDDLTLQIQLRVNEESRLVVFPLERE
jgi:hypothetical protein